MSLNVHENPPENPDPQPRPPAANAVKHGFRASKYLDTAILAAAEAIRADLVTIHEPVSDEDTDLLEDLAIARARYDAVQRSFDSDLAYNRKHAREAFEDQVRKRLRKDLDDLPNFPACFFEPIGQNYEGARWIVGKWAEIIWALGPKHPGITLDQAIFACYACGSHWKIGRMNRFGAFFMSRFVKQSLDPKVELQQWVALSGDITDETRARWYLDRTPDPTTCRQQLLTEAQAQLDRWTLRLNELRPDYETEAATAADRVLPGMPVSPDQPDRTRIPIRYLSEARSQVDRLHRRLDALKKSRPMNRHRAARKAEREARQQLRESAGTPATEPVPQPEPTVHESTETIFATNLVSISPNGFIDSDPLPLVASPSPEMAGPSAETVAPEETALPATVRENGTFESLSEADTAGVARADAPEMPAPGDWNLPLAEAVAETGTEACFDLDFDDDSDTVLDIDFVAEAEVEDLANPADDADDATDEPAVTTPQNACESKDTPISENGRAALPAADRALFERVSDTRIPLSDRIGWLAQRLGVRFEPDPGLDSALLDDDEDDDGPPMTPQERREFEAWKIRMLKLQGGEDSNV